MQQKSFIHFFVQGFSLANKSLDILFIYFFLSIPLLMNNTALSFVFLLINIAFALSIPQFLSNKVHKKHLGLNEIFNIVVSSTRRILLPAILLFFLFGILVIIFFGALAVIVHPTEEQGMAFFQGFANGWHPISLAPIILFSFFQFTAFFFSLENNGIFASMKKSIVVSLKNLNYIALIIFFETISYSITTVIPKEGMGQLINITIGSYISLVITASTLFYYQNVIKKT